jgi:hypothetical protein
LGLQSGLDRLGDNSNSLELFIMDIVLVEVMVHYLHFHMDHLLEVELALNSFLIKKVVDLDNLE